MPLQTTRPLRAEGGPCCGREKEREREKEKEKERKREERGGGAGRQAQPASAPTWARAAGQVAMEDAVLAQQLAQDERKRARSIELEQARPAAPAPPAPRPPRVTAGRGVGWRQEGLRRLKEGLMQTVELSRVLPPARPARQRPARPLAAPDCPARLRPALTRRGAGQAVERHQRDIEQRRQCAPERQHPTHAARRRLP